jgi:transposase
MLHITAGNVSDYKGAEHFLPNLPNAKHMLADRGFDADWFRNGLKDKGIEPCIPPKKNRKEDIPYDKELYKKRHKVENMFAKLKDWRRIAMRYDRCAHTFFSAICIACIVIWYIS